MVVQKGPDLLLEAVPFIHKFRGDAKFVFVGDGHMMESLKGRAAQLGVTHSGILAQQVCIFAGTLCPLTLSLSCCKALPMCLSSLCPPSAWPCFAGPFVVCCLFAQECPVSGLSPRVSLFASSVRFVGKMGGGALHALFKSCDAVVVPSRNEPFGIVVLEAWSASKPVVATNSGGPRDFVNPNITGVLVVSDLTTVVSPFFSFPWVSLLVTSGCLEVAREGGTRRAIREKKHFCIHTNKIQPETRKGGDNT